MQVWLHWLDMQADPGWILNNSYLVPMILELFIKYIAINIIE